MKLRWRQHEMIFVTMLAAIVLAGYLLEVTKTAPEQYAGPFINNHVPFNLYRNVLLPDIGMGLLFYFAYLFINLFTVPRLFYPQKIDAGTSQISISITKMKISFGGIAKKIVKKYTSLILQILLIAFLLGSALNAAIYYKHQWQFNYPGFSIFPSKGYNPNSQINLSASYAGVLFLIFVYALYLCAREGIISLLGRRDGRSEYRIAICNQVTFFLVQIVLLPVFLSSFKLVHDNRFTVAFLCFAIPLFLVFMSNTYWLFPEKGNNSFLSRQFVMRLLISTFLYTVPFVLFPFRTDFFLVFIICWAIQIFVVTPLTWLAYQQRKDKILALVGAQKALVKSKADIQFLRSQINPHFLFNILNTLYGTALQENAERTAWGIQKLGDMMRFMFHENNLDFIDMSREIEYLENYISLQKLRTQTSPEIVIEDNITGKNCHHKISPMLLIPLVENAFKHGISLKEKSWIKINLDCSEKEIRFDVRNSMHPKLYSDPEKERSGIGFKNVLERLKLIYPGRHQISVNGDGKEFYVQLSIQP